MYDTLSYVNGYDDVESEITKSPSTCFKFYLKYSNLNHRTLFISIIGYSQVISYFWRYLEKLREYARPEAKNGLVVFQMPWLIFICSDQNCCSFHIMINPVIKKCLANFPS